MVFVIALAVLGIIFVSSANAQTTWKITIVANGSKEKPTYKVSPRADSSDCADDQNPAPTAEILTVCPGDIIVWQSATTEPAGFATPGRTYIYHEDVFLLDQSKTTLEALNGKPITATVDPKAVAGEQHKYYVAAYDELQKRLYLDDPKIIIGTGSEDDLVRGIRKDCQKLLSRLKNPDAETQGKQLCEAVDKDVQKLKDLLHPK